MVMESQELVHKHPAADAMSEVDVACTRLAGPAALDVISDRTRGIGVKASGELHHGR
jgi:hypothetical protein